MYSYTYKPDHQTRQTPSHVRQGISQEFLCAPLFLHFEFSEERIHFSFHLVRIADIGEEPASQLRRFAHKVTIGCGPDAPRLVLNLAFDDPSADFYAEMMDRGPFRQGKDIEAF
jgi:hypothetical protein